MRLGIMGGTFDPIHLGHLAIGRAAKEEFDLNEVLFLPDGDPPHKTPQVKGYDRLMMVQLAINGEAGFSVSDMELKRKGRTYTVDTLLALREQAPHWDLYYLIGSDTLFQFPTWRTAEKVARLCRMLVVLRPGDDPFQVKEEQARLRAAYHLNSDLLAFRGPDISSSRIREAVKQGQPYQQWVPKAVADLIAQKGFYR